MFEELSDKDPDLLDSPDYIKLQTLQSILLDLVQSSFPDLVEVAHLKVTQIPNPEMLRVLVSHIANTSDKCVVSALLEIIPINMGQNALDRLLDEDPYMLERAIRKIQRAVKEAELQTLQTMLLELVSSNFPNLAEFAQSKVTQITKPEVLRVLAVQLYKISNEEEARTILKVTAA